MRRVADRLLIAGVGLIGGSLAMALQARGAVGEIVGFGRSAANLRVARRRGLIDRAERDPRRAARDVDLVVLAVPVNAVAAVLAELLPTLPPAAVVTDAGSVKAPVVAAVERVLGPTRGRFCGSHPIAGTEDSGAAAADLRILAGERCLMTPTRTTAAAARRRVRALWEAAGMRVDEIPLRTHDRVFAIVSHLPHAAAFALVSTAADLGTAGGALTYAAGGFRDTTRVAGSSPEMWRDIFLANRTPVVQALDGFARACRRLRAAIVAGDGRALERELARARTLRRTLGSRAGRRGGRRR